MQVITRMVTKLSMMANATRGIPVAKPIVIASSDGGGAGSGGGGGIGGGGGAVAGGGPLGGGDSGCDRTDNTTVCMYVCTQHC